MKATFLMAGLALVAFCSGLRSAAAEGLKVGDPFPNLAQFQLEGALPASLEGKVILP